MPDNNNDLTRRLAEIEQQFGLAPRNNTNVTNQTNDPIQAGIHDNLNWKALYKVLESEVEGLVYDPNAPAYVKTWARNLMQKLATRLPR
jgi:hypothetical protein|tara:strand:- start:360 stop:626 length:267 start_codon:yes stop_codon:yes gene_type:complete